MCTFNVLVYLFSFFVVMWLPLCRGMFHSLHITWRCWPWRCWPWRCWPWRCWPWRCWPWRCWPWRCWPWRCWPWRCWPWRCWPWRCWPWRCWPWRCWPWRCWPWRCWPWRCWPWRCWPWRCWWSYMSSLLGPPSVMATACTEPFRWTHTKQRSSTCTYVHESAALWHPLSNPWRGICWCLHQDKWPLDVAVNCLYARLI